MVRRQPSTFTATYVNHRRQDPAWSYDAAGNLFNDGQLNYKWDAAGRNRETGDPAAQRASLQWYSIGCDWATLKHIGDIFRGVVVQTVKGNLRVAMREDGLRVGVAVAFIELRERRHAWLVRDASTAPLYNKSRGDEIFPPFML